MLCLRKQHGAAAAVHWDRTNVLQRRLMVTWHMVVGSLEESRLWSTVVTASFVWLEQGSVFLQDNDPKPIQTECIKRARHPGLQDLDSLLMNLYELRCVKLPATNLMLCQQNRLGRELSASHTLTRTSSRKRPDSCRLQTQEVWLLLHHLYPQRHRC